LILTIANQLLTVGLIGVIIVPLASMLAERKSVSSLLMGPML
jgi:hypothetical protein